MTSACLFEDVIDLEVVYTLDADNSCYLWTALEYCGDMGTCMNEMCVCQQPWAGDRCEDDSDVYCEYTAAAKWRCVVLRLSVRQMVTHYALKCSVRSRVHYVILW